MISLNEGGIMLYINDRKWSLCKCRNAPPSGHTPLRSFIFFPGASDTRMETSTVGTFKVVEIKCIGFTLRLFFITWLGRMKARINYEINKLYIYILLYIIIYSSWFLVFVSGRRREFVYWKWFYYDLFITKLTILY